MSDDSEARRIFRAFEEPAGPEWQPTMSQAQFSAWLTYGYVPFGETTPEPMPPTGVTAEDFSYPWDREKED
jgi:hypothetical protein